MYIISPVIEGLSQIKSNSVHCIVTSPPYWQQRDYGIDEQWGFEADISQYLYNIHWLAGALRRVLRTDGTCWVNIGDKYIKKELQGIPWKVANMFQKQGWRIRSAIVWEKPNCVPHSVKDRPTSSYEMLFLFSQLPKYYYDAYAIRDQCAPESIKRMSRKSSGHTRREPNGMGQQTMRADQLCHPAGRNARDVWTIPSVTTSHGHHSAFPEALVKKCILAGTSEFGVCSVCGAPYGREVDYHDPQGRLGEDWNKAADNTDRTKDLSRGAPKVPSGNNRPIPYTKSWNKSCECTSNEVVQATVLDPFMGSGTVAVVSEKINRNWIGIDIDPKNKEITQKRLEEL